MIVSKRGQIAILVSVVALAAIVQAAGGASACGCGEFRGWVVAHGSSPSGIPWRIKAAGPVDRGGQSPAVEFEFSTGPINGAGGHHLLLWTWAIDNVLTLAVSGSFDSYGDLDGLTARRATKLEVGMSEGEPLIIEPQLAPEALRTRFKWLGQFRFFDVFYPGADIEPRWIRVFDHEGALLDKARVNRGRFELWAS